MESGWLSALDEALPEQQQQEQQQDQQQQ